MEKHVGAQPFLGRVENDGPATLENKKHQRLFFMRQNILFAPMQTRS